MNEPPFLISTQVSDGEAPGARYQISGELVPALHLSLDGSVPVYFEHHVLLWKSPGVDITLRKMQGVFKRIVAGMPIFITETSGPGEIAFSRDGPGQVISLDLAPGEAVFVREHQFLAATGTIDFTFQRVKGVGNMLLGGTGFFIDRFQATDRPGVLWLHGYGNILEKRLGPGEQIDVEPGGWIYRDESVQMDPMYVGLKSGLFAGAGRLVFNRFTGPGRVAIQSMYLHMPTAD